MTEDNNVLNKYYMSDPIDSDLDDDITQEERNEEIAYLYEVDSLFECLPRPTSRYEIDHMFSIIGNNIEVFEDVLQEIAKVFFLPPLKMFSHPSFTISQQENMEKPESIDIVLEVKKLVYDIKIIIPDLWSRNIISSNSTRDEFEDVITTTIISIDDKTEEIGRLLKWTIKIIDREGFSEFKKRIIKIIE